VNKSVSKILGSAILAICCGLISIFLIPPQWQTDATRIQLSRWFGASSYVVPEELTIDPVQAGENPASEAAIAAQLCPEDLLGWRDQQTIEGVSIGAAGTCIADNPNAIAAFVRGTNNVSTATLMAAGLTPDAVEKGADLDGDGDPDEIHIRLEVVELNGGSPDMYAPVTQFPIAPGITPGLWVFAPKTFGMATENFESNVARELLRAPSPTIRIEQGDRVKITLENSHYLPHTIHFHGVDHPFLDANGEGNDGVPITSEMPVAPGSVRTYELQPRQAGTMFYHCHVQVQVHVMMGLQGMFVVEENRPDNHLQTLNVGAGQVRVSSRAVAQEYDREYDLHYTDLDTKLNNIVQESNNPIEIERKVNRQYDITDHDSDYFLLNGRSFPFTFRESIIIAEPDELIKLRVVNGGSIGVSLHSHGHKVTATHYDGVALNSNARVTRDVHWLSSAQRVDLALDTRNDGLHSYGSGVWLLHDHQERGVTNNGLGPGGNLSAIVYEEYLNDNGSPTVYGEDLNQYFDASYYSRIGELEDSAAAVSATLFLRLILLGLVLGIAFASLYTLAITLLRKQQ